MALFPSLTTLICRQTNFAPNALPALAKSCPQLSSLDLSRCSIPKDTDFLALRDLPGLTHLDLSYALFTNTDLRSPASRAMSLTSSSSDAQSASINGYMLPHINHVSLSNGLSSLNLGASQVNSSTPPVSVSVSGLSPALGSALVPIADRGSAFNPPQQQPQFPHPSSNSASVSDSSAVSKSATKPKRSPLRSKSMFSSGSIFSVLATNTPTRSAFSGSPTRTSLTDSSASLEEKGASTSEELPAANRGRSGSVLSHENVQNATRASNPIDVLKPPRLLPSIQSEPVLTNMNESFHIPEQTAISTAKRGTPSKDTKPAVKLSPSKTHETVSSTEASQDAPSFKLRGAVKPSEKHGTRKSPVRASRRQPHPVLPHSYSVPANIMLPPVSEEIEIVASPRDHTKGRESVTVVDEEEKNHSPLSSSNSNNFDRQNSSADPSASPSPPNSDTATPNSSTPLSPTMSYRRSGKKRRRRRSGAGGRLNHSNSNSLTFPLNIRGNGRQGQSVDSKLSTTPLHLPSSSLKSPLRTTSSSDTNASKGSHGGSHNNHRNDSIEFASPLQLPRSLPRSSSLNKLNKSPLLLPGASPRASDSQPGSGRKRRSSSSVRQSPFISPSLKPAHARSMSVSSHTNSNNAHALLYTSTAANSNTNNTSFTPENPPNLPPSISSPTPLVLRRTSASSSSRRRSRSRLISMASASPSASSPYAGVGGRRRSRSGSRAASPPPNFPFAAIVAPLTQLRILRLKVRTLCLSFAYIVFVNS